MDTYNLILDLAVVFYGVRVLIVWWRMLRSGELVPSKLVCPSEKSLSDCRDAAGCRRYLMPRFLLFGVLATISGLVNLSVYAYPSHLPGWLVYLSILLFLAAVVLFCATVSRSSKWFW